MLTIILISTVTGCLEDEVKEKAIDFNITGIDDESFILSDYKDKVVVINFMATWCLPCQAEMSDLVAIYEKYGNEIIMISIDIDTTESNNILLEFKQKYNAEWIFALDTNEKDITKDYKVVGIPMTFIIDTAGYISYKHLGPVEKNEMIREIEKAG
jgi:thiol-disulfide isomerase/thioredoxin